MSIVLEKAVVHIVNASDPAPIFSDIPLSFDGDLDSVYTSYAKMSSQMTMHPT